jgi:hypothetical protein
MSLGPLLFMLASWTLVLSLTVWSFYRLMKSPPPEPVSDEAAVYTGESAPTVRTA